MVQYRTGIVMEADIAIEQHPGVVASAADLAGHPTPGTARRALLASRQERHDDALADSHVGDLLAHLDHATGRLMPEQHGDRPHPHPADDRQVGVADPGRLDLDQALAGSRGIEGELVHADGA